ncbi:hypothetical protein ACFE04_006783 [Oxalis oulophora]
MAAAATVAADAAPPRSSSAADSYIGSLISLTSKSEIRYEGVLFDINTEESSIGLKNVRSFGTEGRKKDGAQVPPGNKVYEYILFRGSDIKDLQVKSSQPNPPAVPINDDPAIIQSHYPPQGATSSTSLAYSGVRPAPDLSSQIPQGGFPMQSHYPPQGATSSASLPYSGVRPAPDLSSQIPQGGLPMQSHYPPQGATSSASLPYSGVRPALDLSSQIPQGGLPMQSHYPPQGATSSVSLPYSGVRPAPDLSSQIPQGGLPMQSHYPPQGATPSTSLPFSGIRPSPDLSSQIPQGGVSRPPFQSSLPLYQPGRSAGPWGPSPTPTTMDASGLAMPPTYWQGYYGPTNELLAQQQQSLLRPPLGVGMSIPPPMQFPAANNSLPTGPSNLQAPQFSEYNPSLIPTMNSGSLATVSDVSTNLIPDPSALDKSAIPPPISEQPKIATDNQFSESMCLLANAVLNEGPVPSLITPGQLLQPPLTTLQSSQGQTAQKDVEVVQVSSSESPAIPSEPVVEALQRDEPVLPLPPQNDQRPYQQHRYPMNSYQNNRRGRGRGRGNEISRSATSFTEDFDFTAMNEKFNKDEVWGHLGKGNEAEESGHAVDGAGTSKSEIKPVYVKDDFFDSLSCDALGGGSRNRKPMFSESRRDNEGYGGYSRYQGGRGYGGGQSRGGYNGRGGGYGHNGRGRGGGSYGMYGRGGESY